MDRPGPSPRVLGFTSWLIMPFINLSADLRPDFDQLLTSPLLAISSSHYSPLHPHLLSVAVSSIPFVFPETALTINAKPNQASSVHHRIIIHQALKCLCTPLFLLPFLVHTPPIHTPPSRFPPLGSIVELESNRIDSVLLVLLSVICSKSRLSSFLRRGFFRPYLPPPPFRVVRPISALESHHRISSVAARDASTPFLITYLSSVILFGRKNERRTFGFLASFASFASSRW